MSGIFCVFVDWVITLTGVPTIALMILIITYTWWLSRTPCSYCCRSYSGHNYGSYKWMLCSGKFLQWFKTIVPRILSYTWEIWIDIISPWLHQTELTLTCTSEGQALSKCFAQNMLPTKHWYLSPDFIYAPLYSIHKSCFFPQYYFFSNLLNSTRESGRRLYQITINLPLASIHKAARAADKCFSRSFEPKVKNMLNWPF